MTPGSHLRKSPCRNPPPVGEADELAGALSGPTQEASTVGSDSLAPSRVLTPAFTTAPLSNKELFKQFMQTYMETVKNQGQNQAGPRERPLKARLPDLYSGNSHMDCYHFVSNVRTISRQPEPRVQIVLRLIFSEISIGRNVGGDASNHSRIEYSVKQTMLVKSLSTSSTINSIVNTVRHVTFYTAREDEIFSWGMDGKTLKAILFEHLAPFLTRLQNLETVNWTHYIDQDPSLYLINIAQSLSSLANLRNVAITIRRPDDANPSLENYKLPPLHTFKNLSALSVSCIDDIPTAYCNREITPAIAASPKLARLSLENHLGAGCGIPVTQTCTSLQTLFGDTMSPQLKVLELRHVPLPAAGLNQTLSHRLKSLTISTLHGSRHLDFAWAELFTTLEKIGVELSQLSVTGMEAAMDEMLSYLISYSGCLQTLIIYDIAMDCPKQEDNAGYRFWDQIVPHHKTSLKRLCIQPWHEGEWCPGPKSAIAIGQCVSLRYLDITVRIDDLIWAAAKLSLASANEGTEYHVLRESYGLPRNIVALILNNLSCPFPLALLTLRVPNEASERAEVPTYEIGRKPYVSCFGLSVKRNRFSERISRLELDLDDQPHWRRGQTVTKCE